jgi:5-methyltetrahydrofolate--homocysteine methyltransferase
MSTFLQALHSGKVLLMDGAMGTELIKRGLQPSRELAPEWNLSHPDVVQQVHRSYVQAGATSLLTNTFTAHLVGDAMRRREAVLASLEHTRAMAGTDRFVFGSIGPGSANGVVEVLRWLTTADALCLETQFSPAITASVLDRLSNELCTLPLVVSFAFAKHDGQCFCPVGQSARQTPEQLAIWTEQRRPTIAALGVNCGLDVDVDDVITIVRRYRQVTDLPILARPNTDSPIADFGRTTPTIGPQQLADRVPELVDAGVTLLGGCCGTTPAHIAAMREVLDKLGMLWQPHHS